MPRSPNRPLAALRFLVAAAGLLAVSASPRPAGAQSFDCHEARNRDELLICEQPDLTQLDQQLSTLYRQKIGNLPKERQDEFRQHEAYFLHARRGCHENYHCIEQSYKNRIQELENFASEEERERSSSATPSSDQSSERPGRPRDRQSTQSVPPFEPSGSSNATAPQREPRSNEGDASSTAINPAAAAEPQSTERGDAPRKVPRQSEHHTKPSRTATSASAAAAQPPATPSGTTAEHVVATRPPATNDDPAKPTIKWVDPAPAR